jgi:hypothetical protein
MSGCIIEQKQSVVFKCECPHFRCLLTEIVVAVYNYYLWVDVKHMRVTVLMIVPFVWYSFGSKREKNKYNRPQKSDSLIREYKTWQLLPLKLLLLFQFTH